MSENLESNIWKNSVEEKMLYLVSFYSLVRKINIYLTFRIFQTEDEEEDESRAEGGSLHESVESLLVRKSDDGPVTSHPFKVIESEVDRRSLNSDSRSVHSRQVSLQRIVSAESLQQKSGKSAEV